MKARGSQGFTLVELMVVAVVVAILAVVSVALMTKNREKAVATEAQAGLGTVRNAMRVFMSEHGHYPDTDSGKSVNNATMLKIGSGDLEGKYFKTENYVLTTVTPSNFVITATGISNSVAGKTVTLDDEGNWGGTLL